MTVPLLLSCRDATGPDRNPLAVPDAPTREVGVVQGPVNIPIAETNAGWGTLDWTGTGLTVPPWTSYVVKVSGRTTVSSNPEVVQCRPEATPPYGSEGSYGPAGDRYYQLQVAAGLITSSGVGGLGLRYNGYGTSGGSDAESDTLYSDSGGQLAMRRSGIQGSTNGSSGCVVWLYRLASSQTISLVTFDGQSLSVTPSAVAVRKGTQVSFRATSGGTLVDTPHWRFDADSGVTNETTACGLSGPNPCLVTVQNSGTLRVSKYMQGRMRSVSARVKVYSSFTLDADKTSLVSGDSVTFTPKLDGVKGKAARWLWRGDDSTVVAGPCGADTDTCVQTPNRSGTMWAYTAATGGDSASKQVTVSPPTLTLTASKSTLAAPGENVTFTVMGSGPIVVLGWSFDDSSGTMNRLAPSTPSLSMIPSRSNKGAIMPATSALPRSVAGLLAPQARVASPRRQSSRLAVPGASSKLASLGSAWNNCTPPSLQCTNFVGNSGIVDVLATVNGDTVRASVPVQVVPCPTGDSVLDDPGFRRLEKLLWDSSFVSKSVNQRFERIGAMIDSAGALRRSILLPLNAVDSLNGPCRVTAGTWIPAGWRLVALIHSHPFSDYEKETAAQCPGGGTAEYRQMTNSGWASPFDWYISLKYHVYSYVLDKNRVVRIRGDSSGITVDISPGSPNEPWEALIIPDWKNWTKQYKRNQSGCSLLDVLAELRQVRESPELRPQVSPTTWWPLKAIALTTNTHSGRKVPAVLPSLSRG